ncbi:hypothetical protein C0216_08175 [Streptomyces globosus]|uniref:Uncharacterized protein n=1 Tax=Streptomyces globosus TaxID=68209 RepID=A0A344TXS4_9ACTN|nr:MULTISPECIES: hypothetical protein [Streptomyces]AXE23445.1 hypothetical protein C0216_08175 [Streptomyces globosus]
MGSVKTALSAVWVSSRSLNGLTGMRLAHHRPIGRFPYNLHRNQELTVADVAFVVTMIAVFALVALIARGVAKL